MAPRRRRIGVAWHPEEVRAKIRASELINRLHAHIFDGRELSLSQVRAIDILLRKCIPDLTSTTVAADINVRYVAELPPMLSVEEWEKKYGIDHLDPKRIVDGTVNKDGNGSLQ